MDWKHFYIYNLDGTLTNIKTGKLAGGITNDGYIRIRKDGKEYRAHRIIWEMFNGNIPEGKIIDHIDGNRINNKIDNLRLCTRVQNAANSVGKLIRSIPKGVVKLPSGKYRARITYLGSTRHLGVFSTIKEASDAYDNKAKEFHGEFAKLNNYIP